MNELTALAAKEGLELPDEVLEAVAGGIQHDGCGEDVCKDYDPSC